MLSENSSHSSFKQCIQDLIHTVDTEIQEKEIGKPIFGDPRYHPKQLSKKNVHSFSLASETDQKVAYIDGGHRHLMVAPAFCISLVRVYFNLFNGTDRIQVNDIPQRYEFFVYVNAKRKQDNIHYRGHLYPKQSEYQPVLPHEKDLYINSLERTIRVGNFRGRIERVADAARRYAEWQLATYITKNVLKAEDILVRDGSLQTSVINESNYAEKLYNTAKRKNIYVTGVAKTSRLYTTTGNSLQTVIQRLGNQTCPKRRWYYYPIVEIDHPDHRAEMYFVKFHPEAEHIFRYEIFREQAKNMSKREKEKIFGILADNARDISFPGYPYGLIDADRFSRVRSDEVKHHLAMLKAEASKDGRWEQFKEYLQATNAHDKLNEVVGV